MPAAKKHARITPAAGESISASSCIQLFALPVYYSVPESASVSEQFLFVHSELHVGDPGAVYRLARDGICKSGKPLFAEMCLLSEH